MADRFLEVAPSEIRYTHDSILKRFSNLKTFPRKSIVDTLEELVYGVISTDDIEPMAVFRSNGYYWSANNRRLWVLRQYERLGGCDKVRVRLIRRYFGKITTTTGGKEIEVRYGGVSGFPANLPDNILKFDTMDASGMNTRYEGGPRKALTKDQIASLEPYRKLDMANLPDNILKFDTMDASGMNTRYEGGPRKALTKDQIASLEPYRKLDMANLPDNILKFDTMDASGMNTRYEGGPRKALTKDQIASLERYRKLDMAVAILMSFYVRRARKNGRGGPPGRQDGGAAQERTSPEKVSKKEREKVKTLLTGLEGNTAAQNRVSRKKEKKKARKKERRCLTKNGRNRAAQDSNGSEGKVLNDNHVLDGDHGREEKNVLGADYVLDGDGVLDHDHVEKEPNDYDGLDFYNELDEYFEPNDYSGLDFFSGLDECFEPNDNNTQDVLYVENDNVLGSLDDFSALGLLDDDTLLDVDAHDNMLDDYDALDDI